MFGHDCCHFFQTNCTITPYLDHDLLLSKCSYTCKNLKYILKCFVCFSGRFSVGWTAGTVWPWRISELLKIKLKKSLMRWADLLVILLDKRVLCICSLALRQCFVPNMGKNERIAFVLVGSCSWERCAQLKKATHKFVYTGCPRRNVRDFRRVFLRSDYTDITQNTYIQSWTVTEIMAGEVWNFDSC